MISLDKILQGVSTVGIGGHIKPDGDSVGSCMGLYLYLKECYPQITPYVFLEDNIPDTFLFLKDSDEIIRDYPDKEPLDVFFALDCADRARLGQAQKYLDAARKTVCIDHHISNTGFGDINEIQPDASSASELVALLEDPEKITAPIAEALYMGIAHDTGIFQYSCTSSRTMRIAGVLMEKGIDFSAIVDATWATKTYRQNQILGRALVESILMLDGKVIFSVIHRKDMDLYGVEPKDMDGIVQQLRVTKGVEAAIFIYESGVREYKVSMRSNGIVDVAKIASYFGGGGHVRAAGCTMQGGVHDTINNLTAQIADQLEARSKQEAAE